MSLIDLSRAFQRITEKLGMLLSFYIFWRCWKSSMQIKLWRCLPIAIVP